jgi:hypothetical protein
MTDMTTWVWFLTGLVAGLVHAAMLWRAARRLTVWTAVMGMLRLSFVAAVLVLAAIYGRILLTACGWAIGLAVLGVWFFVSSGSRAVRSSHVPSKRP